MACTANNGSADRSIMPLRLCKLICLAMIALPFMTVWFGYYKDHLRLPMGRAVLLLVPGLFMILLFFFGRTYGAFQISYRSTRQTFVSQLLTILMADGCMFIVLWIMNVFFPQIVPALITLGVQLVLSLLWCMLARKWYFRRYPPRRTIVIHDMRPGMQELIRSSGLSSKFSILRTLSVEEALNDLTCMDGMEAVFLSGVHSHERNIILKLCVEKGIRAFIIPRIGDTIMSGAIQQPLCHIPMLRVERYNPKPEYLFIKRCMDVIIALLMLILFAIPMGVIALLIKRDGGPVIYSQVRLTKDGKPFRLLKFRSMRVDAEDNGGIRMSSIHDDRVTPIGRIIRPCRLDELPQLINILKGEMSLVGPRPERLEHHELYESQIPEFRLRLQCKAGLTGYAQVYGKYNTTPYDKLNMDLMYIAHPSIWQDLKLLFATIAILFRQDSSEGIADGKINVTDQD